ncbi:thermonuclease family protein [Mycoplasmopsis gallopavonis]|uniref:TNase-like domain-containing protein n=1 Tax=Mycoplasmopsis gallopavonis TaxID=76629 RepID=A0A449B0L7_9BACT|nr:thermonuclease family protein [Mycoplasmopsis gallopavonis]RIV17006.1 thermonuclease family protein [Mycoplasmopsis gallopavonis]VEU73289.1 Uncharacterised protein [Mycoplasmopsis gallopavonis]
MFKKITKYLLTSSLLVPIVALPVSCHQEKKLTFDIKDSTKPINVSLKLMQSSTGIKYYKFVWEGKDAAAKTESKNNLKQFLEETVKPKLFANLTYEKETNGSLFISPDKIKGYPKEFYLKINDKKIKFQSRILPKLNLGKYGKQPEGRIPEDSHFGNVESIKSAFVISYSSNLDGLSINQMNDYEEKLNKEYEWDQPVTPTLNQYLDQVTINKELFQPIEIDWSKVKHFETFLVDFSDGDTFTISEFDDQGKQFKIRLMGIDTPEKAIQENQSSPFEYSFALLSSAWGKKLFKSFEIEKDGQRVIPVRIAFGDKTDKDAYGRITADIFFGDGYKYSYNVEIVRAGYTYPMDSASNALGLLKEPNTYENLIYPKIRTAFNDAIKNRRGFFHYINSVDQVTKYLYNKKQNEKWWIFWDDAKKVNPKQETIKDVLEGNN